ncbi:MAG: hypothetical protein QOK35_1378, partial [Pseudonocardiales bacterium]|nr:hypothetical protein [Pseudonocardiales bacterium]
PSAPAAASAIVQMGVYAGGCAGPIAFGFLAAHTSFPTAWLVGAATMVAAALLVVVGRQLLVAHRARSRPRTAARGSVNRGAPQARQR